ncbi:rhodanese-like domain-containing protein [Maritimibacter fusiformis]|nr:rhodanese-like domain-containing protein [Maritimibacter fusiformis]
MLNFMMGRQATASKLSPQEAVELAKDGAITVVDVRDHNELSMTGKAEGAVHIPLAVIRMQADPRSPDFHPDLDTSKPVAIYCASGARSSMAAQVFRQMGFDEVHNIGGLGHWQMAGGSIVRA